MDDDCADARSIVDLPLSLRLASTFRTRKS